MGDEKSTGLVTMLVSEVDDIRPVAVAARVFNAGPSTSFVMLCLTNSAQDDICGDWR